MSPAQPVSAPTRQLVIAPHTMREAIMLQPLVSTIRRNNPDTQLDAVATRAMAPVLEAMQVFDDIIAVPDHLIGRLRSSWKLAASLRARAYERSYNLNPDKTAALSPWMARIPQRVGAADGPQLAMTVQPGSKRTSGSRPTANANAVAMPLPDLTADNQAVNAILELLDRAPYPDGAEKPANAQPLIVMSPGASDPSRHWPTRHFTNLAMRIKAGCPAAQLVLIGTADERQLCTEIAAMGGLPFLNLAGQLDTARQIALLRQTDVFVCNESDLMHLAAACAAPTVAVFGPSDPGSNPPMSPKATVQWLALECSPCDSAVCPLGHNNCLNLLDPGRVIGAVEQALASSNRHRPVG